MFVDVPIQQDNHIHPGIGTPFDIGERRPVNGAAGLKRSTCLHRTIIGTLDRKAKKGVSLTGIIKAWKHY